MDSFPEYKICSQCLLKRSLLDFHIDNRIKAKRRARCKTCESINKKDAYEESRDDPMSVAKRIIKKCKEREKYRLAKFIKRRDSLLELPDVELTEEQFDIDVDWVLSQRDRQENKCFYTGIDMAWSTGLIDVNKRIRPQAVTIERVDSFGNYVKANCVLACWWANCAKNSGPINELIEYSFEIVKKYVNDNNIPSLDQVIQNKNKLYIK